MAKIQNLTMPIADKNVSDRNFLSFLLKCNMAQALWETGNFLQSWI